MDKFYWSWRVCAVVIISCLTCVNPSNAAFGFGKGDRVRLEDVSVLTLYHGKMTSARRSRAVPQLKCVGGSAGNAFTPQVVQCYNRGSDGYDVQWECKTDMDNAYRFGQIEVTCEGYDSADDDYVLRGSCGLEYTLEYTKEGMQKNRQHSSNGQDSYNDGSYDNYYNNNKSQKSGKVDWLFLAIVGVIIYVMYRTCIADTGNTAGTQPSDDGYPGPRGSGFFGGGGGGGGTGGQPPPPYTPGDSCRGASTSGFSSGGYTGTGARNGGGVGGGGFWTGAAAGGLMGYLFGNRNRGYGGYGGYGGYNRRYTAPRHSGFSSGWGSGGGGGFSGFGGGSTGTRTASGFGGTRRR